MAVSDYSSTPGSNTSISGIGIAENCSPANINNAIRQLMADVRTFYDTATAGGSYQPIDTLLTALAALTTVADKGLYFTGSDTPSTFDLTSYARTLLALASKAAVQSELSIVSPVVTGDGSSGKMVLGTFAITWITCSVSPGSNTISYGGSHTYTTFAKAWVDAGVSVSGRQNNWGYVSSSGLSSASVYGSMGGDGSISGTLFSVGV